MRRIIFFRILLFLMRVIILFRVFLLATITFIMFHTSSLIFVHNLLITRLLLRVICFFCLC
ncbi:hypothetical protein CN605_04760 [Bacillus toyonensis]|nr:hypothetical protein CON60_04650 [Bacillus toyonensis]PEL48151.1 hypothetical protein CN605_04760 [Bacillus toyonensis]PHA83219.1 hypothetical protein COE77_23985 [Bacillus toyonensis]